MASTGGSRQGKPKARRPLPKLALWCSRPTGDDEYRVFPRWVETWLPWIVFIVLVAYIGASAYSVGERGEFSWVELSPFIALVVLGLAFGVWFIVCFTGDATNRADEQDRRRRQSFRFCYVFTLSTIVVMIVPVTNPWQPDVVGPISLIRGCVDARNDNGVPLSIRCGTDDLVMRFDGTTGEPTPVTSGAQTGSAATASSGVAQGGGAAGNAGTSGAPASGTGSASTPGATSQPVNKENRHNSGKKAAAHKPRNASQAAPGAPASSEGAAAAVSPTPKSDGEGQAKSKAAAGPSASDTFERRFGKHKGFVYEPSYPWLIVIGGTYGTASDFGDQPASKNVADTAGAASGASAPSTGSPAAQTVASGASAAVGGSQASGTSPSAAASDSASGAAAKNAGERRPTSRKAHQVIEGGFVLPYYIVLLAFLGASIALTRRIPEFQKRSEPGYGGTADQPPLDFKTVREAVVFQIMQLVTAPFIAMVAFYAISPNTAGSGIAVGFISGFSSELVLLQIRGIVEGLFPKSASHTPETAANTGDVVGRVTFYRAGKEGSADVQTPAANVKVAIKTDVKSGGKLYTDTTDSNGRYAVAGVESVSCVLSAESRPDAEGHVLSAKRLITVAPGAEVIENLILTPPTDGSVDGTPPGNSPNPADSSGGAGGNAPGSPSGHPQPTPDDASTAVKSGMSPAAIAAIARLKGRTPKRE